MIEFIPNIDYLLDICQRIDEQAEVLQEFGMGTFSQEIEQLRIVSANLRKTHEIFKAAERIVASK